MTGRSGGDSPGQSTGALLHLLADGQARSGVVLGEALGLSRAAVWKQVRKLRELGLTIHADRRHGYCLSRPLELLDEAAIRKALDPRAAAALSRLELLLTTGSTNDRLGQLPAPAPGMLAACLAEYQSGGRGRRGRHWLSPLGHGICLSVAWLYETPPRALPALSLVAGVAAVQALRGLSIPGIRLKWPNDLVVDDGRSRGKLGGILVEMAGETGGPLRVIVGIGLNVFPADDLVRTVTEVPDAARPVALDQLTGAGPPPRNRIAAALISALYDSLLVFGDRGFPAFTSAYEEVDALRGQPVTVSGGVARTTGVARGIGADGALMVEIAGALRAVHAGDVTLRDSR